MRCNWDTACLNGKWMAGKTDCRKSNQKCAHVFTWELVARWTGVLFQAAFETAQRSTTHDMDIFRLIVTAYGLFFLPIFGKQESERKKNKPLKFNGCAVKHIARARPSHLSVYGIGNLSVGWWAFHTSFLHVTYTLFFKFHFLVFFSTLGRSLAESRKNGTFLVKVFVFIQTSSSSSHFFFFHDLPFCQNVAYSSMSIDDIWYDICSAA